MTHTDHSNGQTTRLIQSLVLVVSDEIYHISMLIIKPVCSLLFPSDQLQIRPAAHKAVGELNTVLDWLDGLGQKL